MRTKIVAGNWKMNKTFEESEDFLNDLADRMEAEEFPNVTVVVCPPAPYLELASDLGEEVGFFTGSQNISDKEFGAYTGEISAPMVCSLGASFTIIGHSERRTYFGENDELLQAKALQALKHDLIPIFCCGEVLGERNKGIHLDVVRRQLEVALFGLDATEFEKVVIAYEPVWAIGTGITATPSQAQEMHLFIRSLIADKYSWDVANNTSILYGGSCNEKNAAELFSQPDVDGGLIGGASLKVDSFMEIIKAAN